MVHTSPSSVPYDAPGQAAYAVDANMWRPTHVDLPPDMICRTILRDEPDLYTLGTDDLLNLSLNDRPGRLTVNAIVWLNISDESESESAASLHVVAEGGHDIPIEIAPDSDPSSSCYKINFDSEMSVHSLSIFAGETPLDDSEPTRNVPFYMAVTSAEVTALPATVSANVTHVGAATSPFTLTQLQSPGPVAASTTSNSTPISATNSESSNLNIILPAVLVPLFVLLFGALGACWWWRRSRRARMAPSAAFRAENPSMASGQPWVPIDEKRALISE